MYLKRVSQLRHGRLLLKYLQAVISANVFNQRQGQCRQSRIKLIGFVLKLHTPPGYHCILIMKKNTLFSICSILASNFILRTFKISSFNNILYIAFEISLCFSMRRTFIMVINVLSIYTLFSICYNLLYCHIYCSTNLQTHLNHFLLKTHFLAVGKNKCKFPFTVHALIKTIYNTPNVNISKKSDPNFCFSWQRYAMVIQIKQK